MADKHNKEIMLSYGRGALPLKIDESIADWEVIRPRFHEALENAEDVFVKSCEKPIGADALKSLVKPDDKVVLVTSDITRPVPNRLLIPWILKQLPVAIENVTILIGNGSHRACRQKELTEMFGPDIVGKVNIINHNAFESEDNTEIGKTKEGIPISVNNAYVQADKRILIGFIEPHFFAGFSGGDKAVIPGVADIDTICHIHRATLIGHSDSTWGVLEKNPIRREIADMVKLCPPDFLINVTLNSEKEITAIFAGDYVKAHQKGCEYVKQESMSAVEGKFDIVVTSNSGFPLDQNLYQTVKGISAAARIVKRDGSIIVASECSDGVPSHGCFAEIMNLGNTGEDILDWVYAQKQTVLDQWQGQILAKIILENEVLIFSKMDAEIVKKCKLTPISDLQEELYRKINTFADKPKIAVLPDGPLTIPYLQTSR